MLYSASQLIGKTIVLNHDVYYYKVSDINNFGDNAKPVGILKRGQTFVIDSFLAQTNGYTNSIYNIAYAARTYPYFTFFDMGKYYAVAVIGDNRFSLAALQQQGALTVKEEVQKKELENMTDVQRFFASTFGGLPKIIKIVIIAAAIIFLLYLLIPLIKKANQK